MLACNHSWLMLNPCRVLWVCMWMLSNNSNHRVSDWRACTRGSQSLQNLTFVAFSQRYCWPLLTLKEGCTGNNDKSWLLNPGTSSQSEGCSSKWLIWLVHREPLCTVHVYCFSSSIHTFVHIHVYNAHMLHSVKRRRNWHRHDYSEINDGKKVHL